jgi:hypothetical protein
MTAAPLSMVAMRMSWPGQSTNDTCRIRLQSRPSSVNTSGDADPLALRFIITIAGLSEGRSAGCGLSAHLVTCSCPARRARPPPPARRAGAAPPGRSWRWHTWTAHRCDSCFLSCGPAAYASQGVVPPGGCEARLGYTYPSLMVMFRSSSGFVRTVLTPEMAFTTVDFPCATCPIVPMLIVA